MIKGRPKGKWYLLIKLGTLALLGCFLFFCLRVTFRFDVLYPNGFVLGDWLINYEDGGFKRRGLSGSLSFLIQDIFGLAPNKFVFLLHAFLYFFFFFVFGRIFWKKKLSIYYISLILSPLTFLFFVNDIFSIGRKEIFLFCLFLAHIYLLLYKKPHLKNDLLICTLIFVGTLMHELLIFFIPYFLFVMYVQSQKIEIKRYAMYLGSSLVPIILILFWGGEINQGATSAILNERGIAFKGGILFWPANFDAFEYVRTNLANYLLYLIPLVIGLFHFFYCSNILRKAGIKMALPLFALAIIWSAPLFYLAIDWGRWINIHFMLLLLSLLLFIPEENVGVAEKKLVVLDLKYLMLTPFMLVWYMAHYAKGFSFYSAFILFLNDIRLQF